jgi:predicted phage baseplate assembly protein
MKTLAPNFFDRRFDALVEEARSRLPSLAPRWTDYNAHDPGITLLELLAYVAEAQMYSLSRMRRDERQGYAALLGLHAQGPRPASGSLWPDRADPDSPFRSYQQPVIIEADALVRTNRVDSPSFHPTHRILWTAGNVTALRALLADGRVIDLTQLNAQGNRAFEPFGPAAAARDVLRMEYSTLGERGLFPERRALAAHAYWPIGVRAAPGLRVVTGDDGVTPSASGLAVEMLLGGERIEVPVIADGTSGFMQSGVLLLDFGNVPESADPVTQFALEIRAPRGFARPPRALALEAGVLPIEQGGTELAQPHAATGVPNQRIELAVPGLRFGEGAAGPRLVIREKI